MQTTSWNPATATATMSVRWNYDGSLIGANQVIGVTLTLNVPSIISVVQNFSFDVVITGSG